VRLHTFDSIANSPLLLAKFTQLAFCFSSPASGLVDGVRDRPLSSLLSNHRRSDLLEWSFFCFLVAYSYALLLPFFLLFVMDSSGDVYMTSYWELLFCPPHRCRSVPFDCSDKGDAALDDPASRRQPLYVRKCKSSALFLRNNRRSSVPAKW